MDIFIPDSVGSKDVMFENAPIVGTVQFFDGVLILSPFFLSILASSYILPPFLESYSIILSFIVGILGLSLLVIKPNYMTLYSWLQSIWDFRFREKQLEKNLTNSNGKPFESYEAVPDNDTRKLTMVSQVFPERRAIELDNGDILAILSFSGSNLDMASRRVKTNTVEKYARSLSSSLQDDIQFYLPMRPVSLEETKRTYEERIDQQSYSVDNERFMRNYLENMVMWTESLSDSIFVREQYVIVKVTNQDAYDDRGSASSSGLSNLPGGQVLKDIAEGFSGEARMRSKQEIRRKKLRELQNKTSEIGSLLAVGPGNDYSVVSAQKATALIKEFWEGEKIPDDEMNAMKAEKRVPTLEEDKGDIA